MILVLLLLSPIVGAVTFTWNVQSYYSGTGCTGDLIYVNTFRSTLGCSPIACQSGTSGSHSYQQTCGSSCAGSGNCVGSLPSGLAEIQSWSGGTQSCGANGAELTSVLVSNTSQCLDSFSGSGSFRIICNSGRTAVTSQGFNLRNCQGGSSPITTNSVGCSIPFGSSVSRGATCRVATTSPTEPACSNVALVTALNAKERPSSNTGGFLNSATLTFCTLTSGGAMYLSGNSNFNGDLLVDDVLVYQIDSGPVVGLAYGAKCSTSGFLSISEGNIQQVGDASNGPAVSLGTVSAGQHTLKVGVYDCGGAARNSVINLVGCTVAAGTCSPSSSSTTTSPNGGGGGSSGAGSGSTIWSGQYQVVSNCNSGCCCVGGSFTLTQSGTQVTGTLGLVGDCGGQISVPIAVTLASATSTSVSTIVLNQRMNIVKNGVTVTLSNLDSPKCSGSADCTSGDCRNSGQNGGATANAGGDNVCFHHSTVIEYQGQRYTMQELLEGKAAQCRVPHVVTSVDDGVVLETDCSASSSSLHLTGDHLVYTMEDGLKAARQVAVGEVLFADLQQTQRCMVTKKVEQQKNGPVETYFGLNCVGSSQVLANGIKTSTFGHYHAVPAAWMHVVGQWFGIERASRWGNNLASWWHSRM